MPKAAATTQTRRQPRGSARPPQAGARWQQGFSIIGHRGAAGLVAENTLPSFRRAVELGVAAIELDIYWHDGELLIIHDDTLNRTTNGRGQLTRRSITELRQLDAGAGAQIPLLAEVFASVPAQVAINLELKGPACAAPVAAALALWLPPHDVLVSSFDHAQLRDFRAVNTSTPVAPLFHRSAQNMLEVGAELGACAINLSSRIATASRLAAIRDAGFGAVVYTVNSLRSARRLARDGATGVFTDRPDRITQAAIAK